MAQFDRIYRISVGKQGEVGFVFEGKSLKEGLHIEFEINKSLSKNANNATVKIYNLTDTTSGKMELADNICILEVGYSQSIGLRQVFVGYISECYSYWSGADKVTELRLYDGQGAVRDSIVSLSYADDVSRKKIIDDVAKDMGLVVDYAVDCVFTVIRNGFSFIGAGRDLLTKACEGSGLEWSIQNNTLQVLKQGGNTNVQAVKLSPESGLLASPEKIIKSATKAAKDGKSANADGQEGKAGWKLVCLLQPTLNAGDLVYVASSNITGWYKIESLKHTGSYRGKNWYTELEVYEIKGEA